MFQKLPTSIVLLLSILLVSCGAEDVLAPHLQVKGNSGITYLESKSSWLKLKEENGDSYEYTLQVSSWTGHGSRTTMLIENGTVIARNYQAYYMDENTGEEKMLDSYSETGAELGNHAEGARPLTIDALYEICASEYLTVDEATSSIYFDTNEEGVLDLCGYVPNGCVDDCFEGMSFSHFAWR